MIIVDSIENGIVIDHISPSKSKAIYEYLDLDNLDCQIALIKNVKSNRTFKKDIIKIESEMEIDTEALSFIDSKITINIIKHGKIVEKKKLELPKEISNVVKCKNPRCITSIEQEIVHIFRLTDEENQTYRCIYCEHESKL